ncbi:non-ribosomal peptide synthetase [Streptomyces flaveolus]|uniref:non-ribosomal peptide synthetase n=1 Tax=Streptomyces flaveolus TaxID=67297 RepID=UPI0033C54E9D
MSAIAAADRSGHPALSYAQRRLWFLNRLTGSDAAYNVPLLMRLRGPLDRVALRAALNKAVQRHESLRTAFPLDGEGGPFQRIAPALDLPLPAQDVSREPFDAVLKAAEQWATAPFDLDEGPLVRAALWRLSPAEHLFGLSLHHIICDGWSLEVLMRELAEDYADPRRPARPSTLQYVDFSQWQYAQSATAAARRDADWWRSYLDDSPTLLELPADRPRRATDVPGCATVDEQLEPSAVAAVRDLARSHSTTPFTVFLATYALLLARRANVPTVLVGVPAAGRSRPELDKVFGLFVNTLPVRVDLDGVMDFGDLVDRVRDSSLNALARDGVPFERLVDMVRPERVPGMSPLVQAAITVQHVSHALPRLAGLEVETIELLPTQAKFDLDFAVRPAGTEDGALELMLAYNTELFDAATARQYLAGYRHLLATALAAPQTDVRRLPLLGPELRAELLSARSTCGGPARSGERLVHERVAEQAARTPHESALVEGHRVTDYASLNAQANRLAHHLRALGAGPDQRIAVCMPRSDLYARTTLAVLKADAAFLPLDPSQPTPRLLSLLERSGALMVLVPTGEDAARMAWSPVPVLALDSLDLSGLPDIDPERRAGPDDLAYVLYTSGSTGAPKGVAVTHRNLAAYVPAIRDRYGLRPSDSVLLFAPVGFDVSIEEIYPTWLAGGCVVVLPEPTLPPADVLRIAADAGVTVLQLPAAYWQLWTAELAITPVPPAVRLQIVGGDRVSARAVQEWQARSDVPLVNAYGLTETTVTSVTHTVSAQDPDLPVPVGRPVDGVQALVLDADLEPVPHGTVGDLYLGGVTLARGYLGQPGLTAGRFVPHPHAHRPGERLHRTGDRALRRHDGLLVIVGRQDRQLQRGLDLAGLHSRAGGSTTAPRCGPGTGSRSNRFVSRLRSAD